MKNDDFDFKIVKVIDESDYLYYDEIRNKMYLVEYKLIKSGILNGEDLYNLETLKVVDARLKRVQEDQEKISKRKREVYDMLKLSNERLLYEYATNNDFFESRLLKEEILKRMN